MRHKLGYKKLNRTSEHRKALIKNMLNSLIKYEQITTTLPKAKVLKPQADKIITLGKKENLQNTKKLITKLQNVKLASKGYEKTLELVGVGYRAALKGKQLNLQLGFSHDVNYDIPENIKITVEKQTTLKISGSDKQEVGMVASKIKSYRPPEPYKGKGIKEKGQYILRKEGKKK